MRAAGANYGLQTQYVCATLVSWSREPKLLGLTSSIWRSSEEIARKEGETVSFLIQQAIREYLERRAAGANR